MKKNLITLIFIFLMGFIMVGCDAAEKCSSASDRDSSCGEVECPSSTPWWGGGSLCANKNKDNYDTCCYPK